MRVKKTFREEGRLFRRGEQYNNPALSQEDLERRIKKGILEPMPKVSRAKSKASDKKEEKES